MTAKWLYTATAEEQQQLKMQLRGLKFKSAIVGKKKAVALKSALENGDKKAVAEFLAWCLASNGVFLSHNNVPLD